MQLIENIAFYKFTPLEGDLELLRKQIKTKAFALHLKGTIILSHEGINGFLAQEKNALEEFWSFLKSVTPEFFSLEYKKSISDKIPFRRMLVKIKKEIIPLGDESIQPHLKTGKRLTARELKEWYDQGKDFEIIDTRNDYEFKLGTFKDAMVFDDLKHFRNFPEKIENLPQEVKEKPVVMFCTGGIRCEKATVAAFQKGFKDVYQLEGGILKYFEEVGGKHYDGDCFVFDYRVALKPDLSVSNHALCFVCMNPLTPAEQDHPQYVPNESCPHCMGKSQSSKTP